MDVAERAHCYAALGERARLAIIDDLVASDRSPAELAQRHGVASNLLAHHLSVLEDAGLIERTRSTGDGRRRYIRLRRRTLAELRIGITVPEGPVLFVCTHNSARSQMAAAAWATMAGTAAFSAGTHPADHVHPGALAAAARVGIDLSGAMPRHIADIDVEPALVVTVCDRAHEELEPGPEWWHWSIPDPAESPAADAFDRALEELRTRIESTTKGRQWTTAN